MKKNFALIAAFAALVALLASATYLLVHAHRLEARVAKLEAGVSAGGAATVALPQDGDVRFDLIERRLAVLEKAVEKNIVRQGLDGKLKDVRDAPPGF